MQRTWFAFAIILAVACILLYLIHDTQENFTSTDVLLAQRQGLQFEGERRYNTLARLQGPVSLDPDQVDDAFRQSIPMAQTLGSYVTQGSYAPPSGGSGVEQTGAVQAKINFCESQKTVTCDQLKDPRFAECGICHQDGKSSVGKPHRGGMYISSEDQIRANEVATANGGPAVYQPTFGSCAAKNFSLVSEVCDAREKQIQCEKAGAASSGNPCGQCYGSASPGSSGLLYVGPKPRTYTATLWVSHPGMGGLRVKLANGLELQLPPTRTPFLDPKQLTVDIQEGDSLNLTVFGLPPVWCGWLSSPDGVRTVSLDVGMQTTTPALAIAGDKRSGVVNKVLATSSLWTSWKATVPNSVLWYMRRGNGSIMKAWYGSSPSESGADVTALVQAAATAGKDIPVNNGFFQGDPVPGTVKHLWITMDTGNVIIMVEGGTVKSASIANAFQMNMTVPATLVDPLFAADKALCPTGPMVFTEAGAGVMGANSCFKADGSFNPSIYCMQQLWSSAGGTAKGKLYPTTAAAAAALAVNGSLDDTVAFLNNGVNIAMYGVDSNGAPQDFKTVKAAALNYFGITMNNPCDGPTASTGPHSKECLDYLWRTSGSQSQGQGEPDKLPYAYCGSKGLVAPLQSDAIAAEANRIGSVGNIRAAYQNIYNRAHDSSNFDLQAQAMAMCYGTDVKAPLKDPSKCPVQPEVFQPTIGYTSTRENAPAVCAKYGARVATLGELTAAHKMGADWCSAGWVSDNPTPQWPTNTSVQQGCGIGTPAVVSWMPPGNVASVNCYGKKPLQTPEIMPFNQSRWNAPNAFTKAQYLGCFGDTWNRALPNQRADVSFTGDGKDGIEACQNVAIANGDNLFGLQCSGPPSSNCNARGRAQCFTGKDSNYERYGKRNQCGPLGDAWTNQVYSIGEVSKYTKYPNADRGGADIQCFSKGESADICKAKCDADPNCKAYNYVYPNSVWGAASGCCYKTSNSPILPQKGIDFYVKKNR